jgi:hypothetical protein
MASLNKQITSAVLFALGLGLLGAAVPCRAQANTSFVRHASARGG